MVYTLIFFFLFTLDVFQHFYFQSILELFQKTCLNVLDSLIVQTYEPRLHTHLIPSSIRSILHSALSPPEPPIQIFFFETPG